MESEVTKPIKKVKIDADGKSLGRVASRAALLLQGKQKASFLRHIPVFTEVVIINAAHAVLTGNKRETKEYVRYSGYPGGLKKLSFEKLSAKKATEPLRLAIQGMLPKNRLTKPRLKHLKIYAYGEGE